MIGYKKTKEHRKKMKKKIKNKKKQEQKQEQELFEASIGELRYEKMNVSYLLSVLDELYTIGDTLTQAVIENAKERHNLDKIIHAKILFNK